MIAPEAPYNVLHAVATEGGEEVPFVVALMSVGATPPTTDHRVSIHQTSVVTLQEFVAECYLIGTSDTFRSECTFRLSAGF